MDDVMVVMLLSTLSLVVSIVALAFSLWVANYQEETRRLNAEHDRYVKKRRRTTNTDVRKSYTHVRQKPLGKRPVIKKKRDY